MALAGFEPATSRTKVKYSNHSITAPLAQVEKWNIFGLRAPINISPRGVCVWGGGGAGIFGGIDDWELDRAPTHGLSSSAFLEILIAHPWEFRHQIIYSLVGI